MRGGTDRTAELQRRGDRQQYRADPAKNTIAAPKKKIQRPCAEKSAADAGREQKKSERRRTRTADRCRSRTAAAIPAAIHPFRTATNRTASGEQDPAACTTSGCAPQFVRSGCRPYVHVARSMLAGRTPLVASSKSCHARVRTARANTES